MAKDKTGTLAGDPTYWPLAGMESKLTYPLLLVATNRYVVPVKELNIFENISDIRYVPATQRVYFIASNKQKTIYSQQFPDSRNNTPSEVSEMLGIAKYRFEENDVDEKAFDDFNILRLASTKKNLYALAVRSGKEYFVLKIPVEKNGGFDIHDYSSNKLVDLKEIESEIDFYVYDYNNFEAQVFLFNREQKVIYTGKFGEKKQVIELTDFSVYVSHKFVPAAFCLMPPEVDQGRPLQFAIIDSNTNQLKTFFKQKQTFSFKINATIDLTNNYFKIEYFPFIPSQWKKNRLGLNSGQENINIELIILFSNHEVSQQVLNPESNTYYTQTDKFGRIDALNLDVEKIYPLLGRGAVQIESNDGNLTHFGITQMNLACVLPENAIIFGHSEKDKVYALLLKQARDIFFLKKSEEKKTKEAKAPKEPIDPNQINES